MTILIITAFSLTIIMTEIIHKNNDNSNKFAF